MTIPYGNSGALGVNYAQTYSTSTTLYPYTADIPFQIGQISQGTDGSQWIFVKYGTGGVTGLGYVCVVPGGDYGNVVMMSNSTGSLGDKVGVWLGGVAGLIGDYGWLQLYGQCANIQTAVAAVNVPLASTVTAGQVSSTVTTPTKNIPGLFLTTARVGTAGLTAGELNWPTVGSTN